MPRDPVSDEIHDLIRQPLGPVAYAVVSDWLQRFRAQALDGIRAGTTAQPREDAIAAARLALLARLRSVLPEVTRLECDCDRDVSSAQTLAARTYLGLFDDEVAHHLGGPALDLPTAEGLERAKLWAFRQQLERDLDEQVARRREQLHEAVRRLLGQSD